MELSDRKKKILRAIVDLYIRTAEPVASKTIAQMPDMDFSSATIRNEMADLTTLGYLEQPHTSAGRIPSPAGYRLYVDELMQDYRLSTDEAKSINQAMELKMQEVDKEIVMRSLASVGMEAYAERTMDKMSDGECQRIMIARALAQDTPIILLDEPTSFLDMPNRYELCTLLARLAHEENKCILFSTHELDIALSLADAIALIDPPQLSYMPTEEMRRSGCIERLFRNNCVTFDATTGFIKVGQ